MTEVPSILCHRCGAMLTPGQGDFYVVRIEAFADPTPPTITPGQLQHDTAAEISALLRQMEGLSERELMDQVYRRLILHLCGPCYHRWIEHPTG